METADHGQEEALTIPQLSFSDRALHLLREGRILGDGETPEQMVDRVVDALIQVEDRFGTSAEKKAELADEFRMMLAEKSGIMSTPILTNAGRYLDKPLSACTVPSIDLANNDTATVREEILRIHQEGMGTGFNLDELADPVATLRSLNLIAIDGAASGREDRPVGNMATLSVYHPRIIEFVNAKVNADRLGENWKFNTSVDCDANFFNLLEADGNIVLRNGQEIMAKEIFDAIITAAHKCADPGMIFIERVEEDNPTPGVGRYDTVAPCAEVGLARGETCQFGYLNLSKYLAQNDEINTEKLRHATRLMTRLLDNALEISIDNYSEESSKHIMSLKRKIGVGICGLADLFIQKGLMYNSPEAQALALDLVTLINFESKVASFHLAETRGSFGAMALPLENRHLATPSFIEKKYGDLSTSYVSAENWNNLAEEIRRTKKLRNASTISLPPTGRSAIIIDASTGVEPVFSRDHYIDLHPQLGQERVQYIQTAKNITPIEHLQMVAELQRGVDESISKTINLDANATEKEVGEIYLAAWKLGLKGVSVYREGSKVAQPKSLS